MVLQRGMRVPVWGQASPREKISVTFAGQAAHAITDKDGKWKLELSPLIAGGPFEMRIEGSGSSHALKNVLVGEVWIASGQSNMQFPMTLVADSQQEIPKANFEQIRLFTVPSKAVVEAPPDVQGSWSVCSPENIGNFSGTAYFFGRELHRKLGVPVGLIHASWGGTIAEGWTSRETLLSLPQFKEAVLRYEKNLVHFEKENAEYASKVRAGEEKCYPTDPGNVGTEKGWAALFTDEGDWGTMNLPGYWQGAGLDFSGVVWFRREIEIPAAWARKELTLNLCPCDKHDTTYFNNVKIGEMGREHPEAWATPRTYQIPAGLAKPGRNVLAVRVYSHVHAGGIMGSPADLNLGPEGIPTSERIRLSGPWRYKVEHNFGKITPLILQQPLGPGNPHSPSSLFNGMIAPLIPYAIRGAIWYQGEANVTRAGEYRLLFPAMIDSWRRAWRQGDFPFLFVQLANFMQTSNEPEESAWAELREAQLMALRSPNTGMAVTIDIGDALDIHPKNKQDVGNRLAANAFHHVYGLKEVTPSGPLFSRASVEGNKIRVHFTPTRGGLLAKDGPLTGFSIAGENRKFFWAKAEIDGDTLLVTSDQVPKPVAVRYAWANNPICNLSNQAGFPASPFRTDNWSGPLPEPLQP